MLPWFVVYMPKQNVFMAGTVLLEPWVTWVLYFHYIHDAAIHIILIWDKILFVVREPPCWTYICKCIYASDVPRYTCKCIFKYLAQVKIVWEIEKTSLLNVLCLWFSFSIYLFLEIVRRTGSDVFAFGLSVMIGCTGTLETACGEEGKFIMRNGPVDDSGKLVKMGENYTVRLVNKSFQKVTFHERHKFCRLLMSKFHGKRIP